MDCLRSCYSTTMRLDAAGRERQIRWYFTPQDAKLFPGPHRYGSLNWEPSPPINPGVGEIPGDRPYYKGYPPVALSGQSPDGPLSYWRNGAPAVWSPLTIDSAGLPVGCGKDACFCNLSVKGFRIDQFSTNPWYDNLNALMPLQLTSIARTPSVARYRTSPFTATAGAELECGIGFGGQPYTFLSIIYRAPGDPTNRSIQWNFASNIMPCNAPSRVLTQPAWTPLGPPPPNLPNPITIYRID